MYWCWHDEACYVYESPEYCACINSEWTPEGCYGESPIMIDVNSNTGNYRLTSPTDGVTFDFAGNGVGVRTSWTQPNSNVAFLVRDLNKNGDIDNGGEMFGNWTRKRDGNLAPNGFKALEDLDVAGGSPDGKISADDAAYGELLLWRDLNHDGHAEPGELSNLADNGITALFTQATFDKRDDQAGNQYRYRGIALVRKQNEEVARRIWDVFLATVK